MQSAKEKAANIGASAIAGRDKTKAVVQEKVEKMTSSHPAEKMMAEQKKDHKIQEAELNKQAAMGQNAAAKEQARAGHPATGLGTTTEHQTRTASSSPVPGPDYVTEGTTTEHQTRTASSPMPGPDYVTEGTMGSHPIGTATSTGRPAAAAQNPYVEGTEPALRGTEGRYT